jgi:hypothetical protein
VLSEVTATLASEYDLEALLNRFLGMMVRLSGASAGVVRVLTSDGRHLKLAASLGLPPEVVDNERLVDIDCGICGSAIRSDEIKQTRDLRACVARTGQPLLRPVPLDGGRAARAQRSAARRLQPLHDRGPADSRRRCRCCSARSASTSPWRSRTPA